MAGITQTIPNFFHGISQQTDELKSPGQVSNSVNFLPDLTKGLIKRPGTQYIDNLDSDSTSNGCWFQYQNDSDGERYIGKVARNGHVHIWNCATGVKTTVSSHASYFTHSNDGEIQFLQLSDHIHAVNITKNPNFTKSGNDYTNKSPGSIGGGKECYIDFKLLASARQYSLNVYTDDAAFDTTFHTATALEVVTTFVIGTHAADPKHKTFPNHTKSHHNESNPPVQHAHINDASCPDISSAIWSSDHDAPANSDDPNGIVNKPSNRHKLWWRFTVKGISGPRSGVQEIQHSDDYTCQYSYDCELLHGGQGWQKGDEVEFKQEGITYKIRVAKSVESKIRANVQAIRPDPTPFDKDTAINKDQVFGDVRHLLDATNNAGVSLDAEVIGNGIYVKSSSSFNIETGAKDLMNVVTNRVNTVADLPTQCKAGFIVRVVNSEEDVDDYWLQFRGKGCSENILDQGTTNGGYGVDGPGTWVECAKPQIPTTWDGNTMPHRIKRTGSNAWSIDQPDWAKRSIGADINFTNSAPSFYKDAGDANANGNITAMAFWRNRLVLLTKTSIVMSQPGDYYNFWNKTALVVSPVDRVDIAVSSEYPSDLKSVISSPAGLVLFSDNQQFLVTTDSELVTPETVRADTLSSYTYNADTPLLNLGTTLGFFDNAGAISRFYEMVDIRRDLAPTVIDQSKIIDKLLPLDLDRAAVSKENGLVITAQTGTDTIFGLRYFSIGKERLQQAWFRWKFDDTIKHCTIIDDFVYILFANENFVKIALKSDQAIITHTEPVNTNPLQYTIVQQDTQFSLHLDNAAWFQKDGTNGISYHTDTNTTRFALLDGVPATDLVAIVYGTDGSNGGTTDAGELLGQYSAATQVSGSTYSLPGNWTETTVNGSTIKPKVLIGNLFEASVEFPKFYLKKTQNKQTRTDVTASLTLHRAYLNLGPSGKYSTILKRLGRSDYVQTYESKLADSYILNDPALLPSRLDTVPIYDRNTNTKLFVKAKHPSPLTVNSLTWEGDYSPQFYRRV